MKTPWWISDLLQAVMPELCGVCRRALVNGEVTMCMECALDMPRTHLHLQTELSHNPILQRIGRTTRAERAGAYFHYERDSAYARLLQDAKYNSMPRIARELGERYASEIKDSGFFDDIDIIEPVPLHQVRLIRRGYNQAHEAASGISKVTGIPIGHHLKAAWHRTQTSQSATQRHESVKDVYSASDNAQELAGKHVLLLDDIITTGATISACASVLRKTVPDVKISLISLGLARMS